MILHGRGRDKFARISCPQWNIPDFLSNVCLKMKNEESYSKSSDINATTYQLTYVCENDPIIPNTAEKCSCCLEYVLSKGTLGNGCGFVDMSFITTAFFFSF